MLKYPEMQPLKALSQAVKPTLFNATFHPDLLISVFLANLMSDKLEEVGHHVLHTPDPYSSEEERIHALSKLFHYMNGRFYHARPEDFARIWGLQERDHLKDPEALKANDYTMSVLTNAYEHVEQFRPYAHLLSGFLGSGLFPEYVYATIDITLQLPRTLPPMENHPLGITSCADEAILIASLAFNRHCCNLEDIIILGSPLHYLLFLFPDASDGFLFNGKREFFTAASWKDTCKSSESKSVTDAFISRIFTCDRLITPRGYRIFPLHQGTLSEKALTDTLLKVNRFLGFDLPSRMPVIGNDIQMFAVQTKFPESSRQSIANQSLLTELNAHRIPIEAGEIIRRQAVDSQNPQAMQAWYTGRWPDVPQPEAYVQAALTGYKVWLTSAGILTLQDGIDLVKAIPGRDSIFGASGRIALPDEVLLFQTGNGNERALQLFALLKLSEAISIEEKEEITIRTGEVSWFLNASGLRFGEKELQ